MMKEDLLQKVKDLEYLVIVDSSVIIILGLILILYFYRTDKIIDEFQKKHNNLVNCVIKVEEKCNKYIDETIKLLIELNRYKNN